MNEIEELLNELKLLISPLPKEDQDHLIKEVKTFLSRVIKILKVAKILDEDKDE